jgi:flagellar basal-body rod modification protein FlgD
MDTSAISSSTGTSSSGMTSALSGTSATSLGKQDFLKLLVAQLSHQDPLKPMENTEFVAQLAQFSNLEQLVSVNSNLELLQVSQMAMTNGQLAGLIGKEVEASGSTISLTKGGTAPINFTLDSNASEVTLKITDSKGNTVRTITMSSASKGLNTTSWDGKDSNGNELASGSYKVAVSAKDSSGNSVSASSTFTGTVTGVTYEDGAAYLEIGSSTIPVSDIIAVREPKKGT